MWTEFEAYLDGLRDMAADYENRNRLQQADILRTILQQLTDWALARGWRPF